MTVGRATGCTLTRLIAERFGDLSRRKAGEVLDAAFAQKDLEVRVGWSVRAHRLDLRYPFEREGRPCAES